MINKISKTLEKNKFCYLGTVKRLDAVKLNLTFWEDIEEDTIISVRAILPDGSECGQVKNISYINSAINIDLDKKFVEKVGKVVLELRLESMLNRVTTSKMELYIEDALDFPIPDTPDGFMTDEELENLIGGVLNG